MSKYKVTESVSGTEDTFEIDDPIMAIMIYFLKYHNTEDRGINLKAGEWDWDFNVKEIDE
jgi:hypothetical protein